MLHTDFDPAKTAFINPTDIITPVENMPENFLGVFSAKIVGEYVKQLNGEVIAFGKSCMGDLPIYRCVWKDGTVFALMSMPVGAPCAASVMEESIAMGAKRFVCFGSCGALRHDITAGHIIVPQAAVRDEGTSYHYLPPAEEIELCPDCVDAVCRSLDALSAPYVRTKTWTTDAFYRETVLKIEKRKAQGCAVVEMECAAMAAVAKFRGVPFAQFLWAADSLSGDVWDKRNLGQTGMDAHALYMETAVRSFSLLQK